MAPVASEGADRSDAVVKAKRGLGLKTPARARVIIGWICGTAVVCVDAPDGADGGLTELSLP